MAKKRVLVVDDELDMRIFVTTLLETSGYKPLSHHPGYYDAKGEWNHHV